MKKNLLKVPASIQAKLDSFAADLVVVAAAKQLKDEDIKKYAKLGLKLEGEKLVIPGPFIPSAEAGRYSRKNIEGYDIVRKDLPMTSIEHSFETPNFGDWSKGSHRVTWEREVYQRDFVSPKGAKITIELLTSVGTSFTVKFAIDQVLNRKSTNFDRDLLWFLNILQENAGFVDIFESTASLADYTKSIKVDWKILPPGTSVDEVVAAMLNGKRNLGPDRVEVVKERLGVMARLKPTAYVTGSDDFSRYFGAMFADDCVAFENVEYGNAIYVMYDSWKELSKRSRLDLLSGGESNFTRIVHKKGWKGELEDVVKGHRSRRK